MGIYADRHKRKLKSQEAINILLLISGQFVSIFGTRIYNFAISYYILEKTGSALAYSISLAIGTIPRILISPIAGVIADEFQRKKLVIAMDLSRWGVLLIFYLVAIITDIRIIYIYSTILLLNTMDIFFNIALGASIPNIVHKENIVRTNSMKQTVTSIGNVLAPALGGIAISLINIRYFILINSLSFLISGMSQFFIEYKSNNIEVHKLKQQLQLPIITMLKNTADSINYFKKQTLIILLTIYSAVGNSVLYLGFIVPMPYLVLKVFKFSAFQYGIVQGAASIGAVTAALILSMVQLPAKKYKFFSCASLIFCIPFILLGIGAIINISHISKNILFTYMVFSTFVFGLAVVMINVPVNSIQQERIENSYLGRVLGFQGTFEALLSPITMLVSGKLLEITAPYVLPLISGVIFFVMITVICSDKSVKDI